MELDEFKKHWNNIQDKELEQQKYSTETLDHIIMNTTNTLGELKQKSVFWNKFSKIACTFLICALLLNLGVSYYFTPNRRNTFLESVLYVAILIGYALITIWAANKQQQIFSIYNNGDLKEALRKTLSAFKRHYILINFISLFLFPAYFYAMIKLFFYNWGLSANMILMICLGGTIIILVSCHLYCKMKYANKIKELEANLKELEA
jgi:magnesium-transporting ATPase (P-type)